MSKINILVDRINTYLKKRNLPKMEGEAHDLKSLYGGALKSIWEEEDKEKREIYSIDIANFLNPYFGGRNVAEALEELSKVMDREEKQEQEQEVIEAIEEKMQDPNYVPTFDELMKMKEKDQE